MLRAGARYFSTSRSSSPIWRWPMRICRQYPGWTPISTSGPQLLPAASGGVSAFKFRDPEGHPLELIAFPPGAVPPQWQTASHGCVSGNRSLGGLGFRHCAQHRVLPKPRPRSQRRLAQYRPRASQARRRGGSDGRSHGADAGAGDPACRAVVLSRRV